MQAVRFRISIAVEDPGTGLMKLLAVNDERSENKISLELEDLMSEEADPFGAIQVLDENQFHADSVGAAVQKAMETCTALEFSERFSDSVLGTKINHPDRLLGDLVALNSVAIAWAEGEFADDQFGQACRMRGLDFAASISDAARERFGGDYTIRRGGRDVFAGAHIRRGRMKELVRVHLVLEYQTKKVVVAFAKGHEMENAFMRKPVPRGTEATFLCTQAEWTKIKMAATQLGASWSQGVSRIGQTYWSSKPKITVLEMVNNGIVEGEDPALRMVGSKVEGTIDGRVVGVKVRDPRTQNMVAIEGL